MPDEFALPKQPWVHGKWLIAKDPLGPFRQIVLIRYFVAERPDYTSINFLKNLGLTVTSSHQKTDVSLRFPLELNQYHEDPLTRWENFQYDPLILDTVFGLLIMIFYGPSAQHK